MRSPMSSSSPVVLPMAVEQLPFYEYHHPIEARHLEIMARQVREQPFEYLGRRLIVVNLNAFLNGEDLVFSFAKISNVSLGFRAAGDRKGHPLVFLFTQLGNEHQPAMVCLDECFDQIYRAPPKPLEIRRTIGDHLIYNLLLRLTGAPPRKGVERLFPIVLTHG